MLTRPIHFSLCSHVCLMVSLLLSLSLHSGFGEESKSILIQLRSGFSNRFSVDFFVPFIYLLTTPLKCGRNIVAAVECVIFRPEK